MLQALSVFNNREIASGFWLVVLATLFLANPKVRNGAERTIRAFFWWRIQVIFWAMIVYVAMVCSILYLIGFWRTELLKGTITWTVISGFGLVLSLSGSKTNLNSFGRILKHNLRALIIVEYLVGTYVFSLFVELIVVPLVAIVTMIRVVVLNDESYRSIKVAANVLLGMFGFFLIGRSLIWAIGDYQDFASLATVRQMLLAPVLSIVFIPFLYYFLLLITYEKVFLHLKLGVSKQQSLIRYAKRRLLKRFKFKLNELRKFNGAQATELRHVSTTADVDAIIESTKP